MSELRRTLDSGTSENPLLILSRGPVAELEPQFNSAGAVPTPWAEARGRLEQAEVYWLTTMVGGSPSVCSSRNERGRSHESRKDLT